MMGSISQDRSSGVFGELGQAPKMIPVKINLHTSRDRSETYSYEIANDTFLTPLLLNITVFNTITSSERALGESTITIKGAINVKGQEPIEVDRRFSAGNSPVLAAGSVAGPISSLLGSGFDDVQIEGVTLDISSTDTKFAGTLERIALARRRRAAGKTRDSGLRRTNPESNLCNEFPCRFRRTRHLVSCWFSSAMVARFRKAQPRARLCRRIWANSSGR